MSAASGLLHPGTTGFVIGEIMAERGAQDARFGEQNHPDGTGSASDRWAANNARIEADLATDTGTLTWKAVLKEEVMEAFAESDLVRLREELVQVAAVATCWVEALDRRQQAPEGSAA